MVTSAPVRVRAAHRAGPVEKEPLARGHRQTQRCLRCDTLLHVVRPGRDPLKLGRRVYTDRACSGGVGVPPPPE